MVNIIMGFTDILDYQLCIVDINQDNLLDILDIVIMVHIILE